MKKNKNNNIKKQEQEKYFFEKEIPEITARIKRLKECQKKKFQ